MDGQLSILINDNNNNASTTTRPVEKKVRLTISPAKTVAPVMIDLSGSSASSSSSSSSSEESDSMVEDDVPAKQLAAFSNSNDQPKTTPVFQQPQLQEEPKAGDNDELVVVEETNNDLAMHVESSAKIAADVFAYPKPKQPILSTSDVATTDVDTDKSGVSIFAVQYAPEPKQPLSASPLMATATVSRSGDIRPSMSALNKLLNRPSLQTF
jgi:hypothetical protein